MVMVFSPGNPLTAAQLNAGMADYGWASITVAGGFTGSRDPAVRLKGGVVEFRGYITGTLTAGTTTQIGTVPAGAEPPAMDGRSERAGASTSTGQVMPYLAVNASGQIMARPSTTGSQTVALGGLSGYLID